jgi:hypothetical protein
MPEIDRILRKTITDPVGQGFMAPLSFGIAALTQHRSNCFSVLDTTAQGLSWSIENAGPQGFGFEFRN